MTATRREEPRSASVTAREPDESYGKPRLFLQTFRRFDEHNQLLIGTSDRYRDAPANGQLFDERLR